MATTLADIFEDLFSHDPAKKLLIVANGVTYPNVTVVQVDAYSIKLVATP